MHSLTFAPLGPLSPGRPLSPIEPRSPSKKTKTNVCFRIHTVKHTQNTSREEIAGIWSDDLNGKGHILLATECLLMFFLRSKSTQTDSNCLRSHVDKNDCGSSEIPSNLCGPSAHPHLLYSCEHAAVCQIIAINVMTSTQRHFCDLTGSCFQYHNTVLQTTLTVVWYYYDFHWVLNSPSLLLTHQDLVLPFVQCFLSFPVRS